MDSKLMDAPVCAPPHTEPAERSILASVICEPSLINDLQNIRDYHFYSVVTQRIFKTVVDMLYHDEPVAIDTLCERLPDDTAYISELCENAATYTKTTVLQYAKKLQELYRLRALRDASIQLQQAIENGNEELIDKLQNEIAETRGENVSKWSAAQLSPRRFFETEPAPFEFIIPGLLAKGITGFVYGEGGSYKSLAALWLVIQRAVGCVDSTSKWLDTVNFNPGRSIFASAEEVGIDLHHRAYSIINKIHENRPELPFNSLVDAVSENCLIISREQWTADGEQFLIDENGRATKKYLNLVDLIKSFHGDLCIIETMSRVALVDENDNQAAARVVSVLENLRDDTGATILCIAHSGKIARGMKTDTFGQNGLRGASALMDNSRFGLWFRAMPKENGRDILEIHNSKTFRTKRADTFQVCVEYPAFLQWKDEGKPSLFDRVVDDIKTHPGAKTREIRERLKGGANPISRALKDAIAEDRIFLKGLKEGYFINE